MSRERHGFSNHRKLVNQLLFQANIEENIKVLHYWPYGNPLVVPIIKGINAERIPWHLVFNYVKHTAIFTRARYSLWFIWVHSLCFGGATWQINSTPSAAYMRQWIGSALVQIMACRQCYVIVNWATRNKLLWNFNQNTKIFIQENSFENVVCEMASILSRPQCVK